MRSQGRDGFLVTTSAPPLTKVFPSASNSEPWLTGVGPNRRPQRIIETVRGKTIAQSRRSKRIRKPTSPGEPKTKKRLSDVLSRPVSFSWRSYQGWRYPRVAQNFVDCRIPMHTRCRGWPFFRPLESLRHRAKSKEHTTPVYLKNTFRFCILLILLYS